MLLLLLQSKKGAELIYKHPILLDACVNEMQRVGDSMMSKWAEVRVGPVGITSIPLGLSCSLGSQNFCDDTGSQVIAARD